MNGQEQPKSPEQVGQEQHDQFIRQLNKMKTRTLKLVLPSPFFVDKTALVRVPRTKAQRKARRRAR
jgi:hypothetical protein